MSRRLLTTPCPLGFRPVNPAPLHQRVASARLAGVAALADLMMERMLEAATEIGGACTADDLARAGFTAAEVVEIAPDAAARAGRLLAMRESARAVAA